MCTEQLKFFIYYHGRLGHMRPCILRKNFLNHLNDQEIAKECVQLYNLEPCHCCDKNLKLVDEKVCKKCMNFGLCPCDVCEKFFFLNDLRIDGDFGNSICQNCDLGDRSIQLQIPNNIIYETLISITNFKVKECPCGQFFFHQLNKNNNPDFWEYPRTEYMIKNGIFYPGGTHMSSDKIPEIRRKLGSLCWNCQISHAENVKNSMTCSTCHENYTVDNLVKCDHGCCWQCPYCRVECDICEIPQCHNTKHCKTPGVGKKKRCVGRECEKCGETKKIVCNSYSQCLVRDDCPHPWCRKCEKHNGEHINCYCDY